MLRPSSRTRVFALDARLNVDETGHSRRALEAADEMPSIDRQPEDWVVLDVLHPLSVAQWQGRSLPLDLVCERIGVMPGPWLSALSNPRSEHGIVIANAHHRDLPGGAVIRVIGRAGARDRSALVGWERYCVEVAPRVVLRVARVERTIALTREPTIVRAPMAPPQRPPKDFLDLVESTFFHDRTVEEVRRAIDDLQRRFIEALDKVGEVSSPAPEADMLRRFPQYLFNLRSIERHGTYDARWRWPSCRLPESADEEIRARIDHEADTQAKKLHEALEEIDQLEGALPATLTAVQLVRQQEEADRQGRFQRLISVIGAAVLGPSLVASVFGANVSFSGQDTSQGFFAMLALMLAASTASWGALVYFEARRPQGDPRSLSWFRLVRQVFLVRPVVIALVLALTLVCLSAWLAATAPEKGPERVIVVEPR